MWGIFRSGEPLCLMYFAQKINHGLALTAEVYKALPSCSIGVKILAHGQSSSIMYVPYPGAPYGGRCIPGIAPGIMAPGGAPE